MVNVTAVMIAEDPKNIFFKLGLARDFVKESKIEFLKSYCKGILRFQMNKTHPDKNPGDKPAEEDFKVWSAANEVVENDLLFALAVKEFGKLTRAKKVEVLQDEKLAATESQTAAEETLLRFWRERFIVGGNLNLLFPRSCSILVHDHAQRQLTERSIHPNAIVGAKVFELEVKQSGEVTRFLVKLDKQNRNPLAPQWERDGPGEELKEWRLFAAISGGSRYEPVGNPEDVVKQIGTRREAREMVENGMEWTSLRPFVSHLTHVVQPQATLLAVKNSAVERFLILGVVWHIHFAT